MKTLTRLAALALLAVPTASVFALNILLCDDDGITAANIRALKQQLVADGHSVVITGPIDNQSSTGGFIRFLQPIPALTGAERGAVALGLPAGTPGVGHDPTDPNVFYVNGTPVMACLYGIDVEASKVWGQPPDLVISGPNEGNNTGHIDNSSGTFNAMVYAVNRKLTAIAVSDYASVQVTWSPNLPADSRAFEVAGIFVRMVGRLAKQARATRSELLTVGLGLNVNVLAFAPGAGSSLPIKLTHVGFATAYAPAFYERLSDSPVAVGYRLNTRCRVSAWRPAAPCCPAAP